MPRIKFSFKKYEAQYLKNAAVGVERIKWSQVEGKATDLDQPVQRSIR